MVLDLVRNDRLVAGLRSKLPIGDDRLTIYRGYIRSVAGSWARLAIEGDRISGVIWDGNELLLVDRAARLEGLQAAASDENSLAAVRLADIELPIDDGQNQVSAEELVKQAGLLARQYAASEGLASRAISLGVVIDTTLAQDIYDVVQVAIEWTNVADGIFTEQVGIHLDLDNIVNLEGMPDPFSSSNPRQLLSTLADFKATHTDFSPLGLTHLLTRIDLDGDIRGIAQLASTCGPTDGVGLTEARGSAIDALIMTHEIAHNLGAPHDNEAGSPCASTPDGYLMSPTLNNSSTFSSCSVAQMLAYLNTVSCLTDIAGSEIELEPPGLPAQLYYKENTEVDFNVSNVGLESVVDGNFDIDGNGGIDVVVSDATDRDCRNLNWQSQQNCDLDNLYAGETVVVSTEIAPQSIGQQSLDVLVSASNDTDPSNNTASYTVEVLPATDAGVDGFNLTNVNTYQGGSVTYSLTASNHGDFDTTAVVNLQTEPEFTLSSPANCTSPGPGRLECDIGLLPAGGTGTFEFDVHVDTDLGLAPADRWDGYIDAFPSTSLHNTAMFLHRQFSFYVWGAFYDVEVAWTEPPVSVDEGESSEFVAYVTNFGPDPVPGLTIQASVEQGVEIGMPVADRGSCTTDGQFARCALGQFDPGETVSFRYPYTGVSAGKYQVFVIPEFDGGYETGPVFPQAYATFDVLSTAPPPPPPSTPPKTNSGGGGGGASPLWLLTLLSGTWWSAARRPTGRKAIRR